MATVYRIRLSPIGGIAGDMFAAAAFDAFPVLYDEFLADLDKLGIPGLSVSCDQRLSCGLQANHFSVAQNTEHKPPRTLTEVSEFITSKSFDESVEKHMIGLFTVLAGAEAKVHGKSIDTIHFHEVSDWDSIVDMLAAAGIIARLQCRQWYVDALPLGGGTVHTAHGDIAVPAPATLALLENFSWHDDGLGGERVTPTGAAILNYLGAIPPGSHEPSKLIAVGSGCGTMDLQSRANLLRVMAFAGQSADSELDSDEVSRIGFEVDDMTAEELSWAQDKLRAREGVFDVSCIVLQGKKGRASMGVRILTAPDVTDEIIELCFKVTSTLGVRFETVKRKILKRTEASSEISVKVARRPGSAVTAKASSDALNECMTLDERRQVASQSQHQALETHSFGGTED